MSSNDFCVIVPTYNNIRTLSAVIDSILPYTSKLIVVNDGSTDGTDVLLDKKKNEIGEGLEVVSYAKNKGKWNAISKGLGAAVAAGAGAKVSVRQGTVGKWSREVVFASSDEVFSALAD